MRVRPAVREALAGGSDRRTGCGGFFAGVVGVIRAGCERCFLLKSCLWRKLFSRGRGGAKQGGAARAARPGPDL